MQRPQEHGSRSVVSGTANLSVQASADAGWLSRNVQKACSHRVHIACEDEATSSWWVHMLGGTEPVVSCLAYSWPHSIAEGKGRFISTGTDSTRGVTGANSNEAARTSAGTRKNAHFRSGF